MLTKITICNFKRFREVEVELGSPVVFIGPNNSGKTSALQALALWDIGVKRWMEKRGGNKKGPEKRPGVTINRRDLLAAPVPDALLLWRNLHVREGREANGKTGTTNVRIDITVEGVTSGKAWECGLEFDYANDESFYCRPLRLTDKKNPQRMIVPEGVGDINLAFLPPMSGLAAEERRVDPGAINVLIGEGRTAEVLRNLCLRVAYVSEGIPEASYWQEIKSHIEDLFGAELDDPKYVSERGEIVMTYRDHGTRLDISCSGRGLQQTLLLLAYMYANPGAVLLLDEPDAHLEILRQRQIYQLLTDVASKHGSQIIAASHSEVLLGEAAGRDVVVAFLGSNPKRIDDRGSQVLKSLKEIGFDQYYQAEQTGWVLYLEGSTDLAILRAFAETLEHDEAKEILARPFVKYVGSNNASDVSKHFYGVKEAYPALIGIAIFDRLAKGIPENLGAEGYMWKRREIENYFCSREVLEDFAISTAEDVGFGPLFIQEIANQRQQAMEAAILEMEAALTKLRKGSPWDENLKVSDEFLEPLFGNYYEKLGMPNLMAKKNFYVLARFVKKENIAPEVKEILDAIVSVATRAKTEMIE